jgi:hypothetical protein
VAFENLQNAAWILKGRILQRPLRESSDVFAEGLGGECARMRTDVGNGQLPFSLPARGVILALLAVITREEAIQILGVPKSLGDEGGGVGVIGDVVAEERVAVPALAAQDVIDESA